jgi:type I restriction enzyme S subunit
MDVLWEIPTQWKWVEIKTIGEVVSGGTPSTKEGSYWGGDISWISPSDLTDYTNKTISRGAKSITEKGLKHSSAKLMPSGSVHFSSRAPIGYVAISSQPMCTNQGFKSIVPSQGVFNEYLYYYLKASKQIAEQRATGTTFKELSGTAFSKLPIPIAPTNEQCRIVEKIDELFSVLDQGVESLKAAREQLNVYRQVLLKHAFEGKLTEKWRKDNAHKLETADQLLQRIKQQRNDRYQYQLEEWERAVEVWEVLGKIGKKPPKPRSLPNVKTEIEGTPIEGLPRGWHCLQLMDIILSLGQGWSPKCNNIPAGESEWGVIKTTAIQHLNYIEAENKQLPFDQVPRPWLRIEQNDILITRAGPRSRVGVVCRVSATRDKLILCDKAYRMQFPESDISPAYVEALLNTEDFKRKIETLKTGISDSGVNITQPRLLGLYFPVPPMKEQLEIRKLLDERLSVIECNVSDIDDALKKSEALRQSILRKAFSGELVPQEPEDEPASVLLDRIAKEKEEAAARAKESKNNVTRKAG